MNNNIIPKIVALYLPQYHCIPDNDIWWGKGFTEWTNVKKAKPLFEKHNQPRVPLDNNYYDLTNSDVMYEQASLAAKFGIGGFCFYHYWFEGRKLLEKPVEAFREDRRIDFPYCLCWANHTWLNSWGPPRLQDEILVKQGYGNEKEWKQHFDYLLDFFLDKNYIRIDNKPIFLLYVAQDIPRVEKMISMWNFWATESGLEGIYFVQMHTGFKYDGRTDLYNAKVDFEPTRSWNINKTRVYPKENDLETLQLIDYDLIYEGILARQYSPKDHCFYGAFTGWDNTPRQGRWGLMAYGATPDKFQNYLLELLKKSFLAENEIVLINAWNEWAEGAYLEPDEQNGYGYLQAVKNALTTFSKWKDYKDCVLKERPKSNFIEEERQYGAFKMANRWLNSELAGVHIADFFIKAGYCSIAIYGAGYFGMNLIKALENTKVEVSYIIDKNSASLEYRKETKLVSLIEAKKLSTVDAIIVTVVNGFTEIYYEIREAGFTTEIISINAIIDSL